MQRLFRDIIGMPVFAEDFGGPVAVLRDLVIDSENGKVMAVVVNKRKNKVIVPMDILAWKRYMRIRSADVILEGQDVVRVHEVQKRGIAIFGNKVVTESGKGLGIVSDYVVDTKFFEMKKIFVSKNILGIFSSGRRIIPAKDIIEVRPEKIVVRDDLETVKETATVMGTT